jgi:LacI family transcriptional regulator
MARTLADVAKRAGVSTATVSRVLNNKMVMPIPQTTVERIRRAAEELQYRPNAMARALVSRKTHTLGLFSQEMTDPHFAQMLEAVEAGARARGYHLIVSGDLEGLVAAGRVDGVVVLARPQSSELMPLLCQQKHLFVWNVRHVTPQCVAWSDFEGAGQAGRYLLELGHRRIAALFGSYPQEDAGLDKVQGFRQAMESHGVAWKDLRGERTPDQMENGYLLTRDLLRGPERITALFARNDLLAIGAMRALREARLIVPEDVSVIGYNDTLLANCADPPLTSVRTPIAQAGQIAVEQLVRNIAEEMEPFPGTVLATSLTVRASVAPARAC